MTNSDMFPARKVKSMILKCSGCGTKHAVPMEDLQGPDGPALGSELTDAMRCPNCGQPPSDVRYEYKSMPHPERIDGERFEG